LALLVSVYTHSENAVALKEITVSVSQMTGSSSHHNPAVHGNSVQSSSQHFHLQPAQLPVTQAKSAEDSVHLSQLAQIQQMALQGESASAIASATGLTVSQVDSDLDVSTTASSVSAAASSSHSGVRAATAALPSGSTAAANAVTSASKAAAPAPTLSVHA
jgi:hypothetical protein